jgi:serine/threonine protein kinase
LEYVSGGSLAERIAGNPQPPGRAARLIATLALAIDAAHRQGVLHRDLKPGNVLLSDAGVADGDDLAPKIADFGLAKFLDAVTDPLRTLSGALIGTASYMSPEQAGADPAAGAASVGAATDVYALGAILYELITGGPPFKAATVIETARLVRETDVVPPRRLQPGTPVDLETICLKCLQKEPSRRYESALELADDLRRFSAGEPVRAGPLALSPAPGDGVGEIAPSRR